MQRIRSFRIATSTSLSWKQRIIGCFLLLLAVFLDFEPLWECHDHLDNLRHMGPHGVLVILLLVACTGISLLKSLNWLSLHLLSAIVERLRPIAVAQPASSHSSFVSFTALPPPLRI